MIRSIWDSGYSPPGSAGGLGGGRDSLWGGNPDADRTGLGMDISRARMMYTRPPNDTPDLGPSSGAIFNPATGQMEDRHGNPLKLARRQMLQPGQTGNIDPGGGPTQYVRFNGAPVAGGFWGISGPNWETGFRL